MKNCFLLIIACFAVVLSFSQEKKYSVYLIGDAGEHTQPHEALLKLKQELNNDEKSSVLFLGDNVYPSGLDLKDSNSILRMNAQLNILKSYVGQAYIIPGNHDWDAQKRKGNKKLYAQQLYVDSFLRNQSTIVNKLNGAFYPKDALPGPHSVLLANKLRLIIIDTQWFLHVFKKNSIGSKKILKKCFLKS
ncbi:MAG: metallophosphoesterase [Bacteroidetes bacterium]|nr:metallophosphoesterase [Bacteroidota bacterium]